MPLKSFNRLAEEAGDPGRPLQVCLTNIFDISSLTRCGPYDLPEHVAEVWVSQLSLVHLRM